MAARFPRLAALLLLALAFGGSPASAADGKAPFSAFCPVDHALLCLGAQGSRSPQTRLAFHCRCCGRDENGHCNHQCCDDQ
jgi:hypothetical protein